MIAPIFSLVGCFSESLAQVSIDDNWGYINKAGEIVIPPLFESAVPFSEGMAAISIHGKDGFINHEGEIVVEPRFDLAGFFLRDWQ